MRDASKILAYFAGILLAGCLFAPPLYWAGHASGIAFLMEQPFQRYFSRSIMLCALALLWPMMRFVKICGLRDLGLRRDLHGWRHLGLGFLAAGLLLFAMGLLAYGLDLYRIQSEIRWDKIWKIPGTVVIVALLEEFLFRAGMLGIVRRGTGPWRAALFVSAIYSIVHFLKPGDRVVDTVTWASGFVLLPDAFHQFSEPAMLLGGFATLFAIGMVLAWSVLRTGNIWMAVGLHMGWIAANRFFHILFRRRDDLPPWFGERIEIGVAPLLTVVATGLLLALLIRREPRPSIPS